MIAFLTVTDGAMADYEPDYRLSGFATFGLVTSDHDSLGFRRDLTQEEGVAGGDIDWKTDSLVGLQWQARWSPKFDATLQVVAKDRFKNTLENSIEWAFIRYRPVDGLDFRVGRLGSDLFMLSEYRQVGYAFPWVRPPTDYYGLMSLYHFDGVDVSKRFDLAGGTLNVKVFYGNSDEEYPVNDESGRSVRMDISPAGLALNLEWQDWEWRYTYADVSINNNTASPLTDALQSVTPLWPEAGALAQEISTDGKSMIYHELGVAYDNNTWWAQAEATDLSSDSLLAPNSRHFYVSVGRRFGPFSIFGLGGIAAQTEDAPAISPPPGAEQLAGAVSASIASIRLEQDSIGLGARWNFRPKMALKIQANRFDIDETGNSLWVMSGPRQFSDNQVSTVVSLSLDVLF